MAMQLNYRNNAEGKPHKTRKENDMNTNCKIDFVRQEIRITKKFYRESQYFMSEAYRTLCEIKRELPSFTITVEECRRMPNHSQNPTYAQMEQIIRMKTDCNSEALKEFVSIVEMARMSGYGYGAVRKWFMEHYYIENEVAA